LTMIQEITDDLGLTRPNSVISSTDRQIQQLLAIANREGHELAGRHIWQKLDQEALVTTVAAELQGALTTLAPGYKSMIYETMWDRSLNRPIQPLSAQEWQAIKSNNIMGPYTQCRIWKGNLYAYPVPPAGHTWAFEYHTKNWCSNAAGDTTYTKWNADTDVGLLEEDLMKLGIMWRWLKRKGLDYSEDYKSYELLVEQAKTDDKPRARLHMGNRQGCDGPPDARLAEGNWSL